jgi:hypothetical protein
VIVAGRKTIAQSGELTPGAIRTILRQLGLPADVLNQGATIMQFLYPIAIEEDRSGRPETYGLLVTFPICRGDCLR